MLIKTDSSPIITDGASAAVQAATGGSGNQSPSSLNRHEHHHHHHNDDDDDADQQLQQQHNNNHNHQHNHHHHRQQHDSQANSITTNPISAETNGLERSSAAADAVAFSGPCFNGTDCTSSDSNYSSPTAAVAADAASGQAASRQDNDCPSSCPSPGNNHRVSQSDGCCDSIETNTTKCLLNSATPRPACANNDDDDDDDYVTILHFNDCYNIEPGPQSSGAAGFLTAINQYKKLNPMILFSGDILSPSFMSTFTKGEQMIPVLNDIGVHCAVFGNHEFDYGVDNLIDFVKRTTFPWLLSNVIDKETSNQLGDGQVFHVIERAGLRFGLIGLIEEEWLSTLATLDSSDVIYQDFVSRGRELARWLKAAPNNVDYVIALTHFRTPNDIRLADSVPEIDLILGGHDHDYEIIKRPNCYIIKSGTDFREFSKIKLKINPQYRGRDGHVAELEAEVAAAEDKDKRGPFLDLDIEHVRCLGYEANASLQKKLEKFVSTIDEKMGKVLGQFNCELDGRFSSIRKFETNLGNFVCDIMLASTHADLAILNSGTLRSDRVHPRGDFTMRDLFNILGYIDPIAVLLATGEQIWKALENGVSQWPKLEGRFPQVSGCCFTFDPSKPPMQRIDPRDIIIGDEQLILDKHYRLTTKAYLALGKDGYDMLKECEVLVPGDESPDLTTSILNHFEAINIVKSRRRTHHRQSIICLSRGSLKKILDETGCEANMTILPPLEAAEAEFDERQRQRASQPLSSNDDNNNLDLARRETSPSAAAATASSLLLSSSSSLLFSAANESLPTDLSPRPVARTAPAATPNGAVMPNSSSPLAGTVAPTPSFRGVSSNGSGELSCCGVGGAETPTTSSCQLQQPPPPRTKRLMSLYEMEHEQCKLEPKIEGRIRVVGV